MGDVHLRRLVFLALLTGLAVNLHGQNMPGSLIRELDSRFTEWRFVQYSLPKDCISQPLYSGAKPCYSCYLDADSLVDFALALETGMADSLKEFFVAAICNGVTYRLFVIDSSKAIRGAGHRYLFVFHAGERVNIFGEDEVLSRAGRLSDDGMFITFDVDVIQIAPICEAFYKAIEVESYVFLNGAFREFSSAD
jgi:hypothetical protein